MHHTSRQPKKPILPNQFLNQTKLCDFQNFFRLKPEYYYEYCPKILAAPLISGNTFILELQVVTKDDIANANIISPIRSL